MIGKPINKNQIASLLKPTWSVNTIIKNKVHKEINEEIVKKMIRLSGLRETNIEEFTKSLNTQLSFINSLYETGDNKRITSIKNKNNNLFRLIKSDHRPDKPLTLEDIEMQIRNLKPDEDKGEIGFGIGDYFYIDKSGGSSVIGETVRREAFRGEEINKL